MKRSTVLWVLFGACAAGKGASADLQAGFEAASMRAANAEAAVVEVEDRLATLESLVREGGGADADTVEAVRRELAALRGDVEVVQFEVRQLRADLDQAQIDRERRDLHAEARLAQLEQMLGVTPPPVPDLGLGGAPAAPSDTSAATPPPPAPTAGNAPTPGPAPTGGTAAAGAQGIDARVTLAEQRMRDGQQAAARAILEGILSSDPGTARAAEVQYRIAETHLNEGAYRDAARAFQVVTDRHEKSAWAPWAMLRIGECFDGMGRADAAKTFYDGVVRNFPKSDAAREARALLKR